MKEEATEMLTPSRNRARERGQSIVILAGGLMAMLAMVGLVVDGGNAFAHQRSTQNGIDAASEAGAVELARRMVGLPPVGDDVAWDQRVLTAVTASAANNGLTSTGQAEYTDYLGNPLGAFVGNGVIPANTQGVHAGGSHEFSTLFVGALGFTTFTAAAEATAVTGYAEDSGFGGLIPLALPVTLSQCQTGGGSNRLVNPLGGDPDAIPPTGQWPVGPENVIAIPLCSNGPGNVGWIDWTPPFGGASEIGASIRTPNNGPISTKHWYFINETGAITSLDDDLDTWEGKDIMLPIFYAKADDPATSGTDESLIGSCSATPTGNQDQVGDCPPGQIGFTGGQGWYFLISFGDFHLEHSYIQGNHEAECNDPSLISTATYDALASSQLLNNCLIGYFNGPVIGGNFSVGAGTTAPSSFTPFAIQLIK